MTLNQDQQDAATAVIQFLMSPEKSFPLSGPAGTGKTFMMKHIMNTVLVEYQKACQLLGQKYRIWNIALTATTNKAAEQLAEATGFPVATIHSHMGLRVYDDFSTGVSKITKSQSWCVHQNELIFIDEASMVDKNLYELIQQTFDDTCKIIYIGDHCQLAPVNEKISKVYDKPKRQANLTQPMRNAGQPALMSLCNQLRATTETLKFKTIHTVPGVIDHFDGPEAQAWIDDTFAQQTTDHRILAFTNLRVQEYNTHIRDLRGYPDYFVKGEILNSNKSLIIGNDQVLRVEQQVTIKDDDLVPQLYVVDEDEPSETIEYYTKLVETKDGIRKTVKIPYDFDHYSRMINYYASKKNWPAMYSLKNGFADLRQMDASTIYKAQGSTFDSVLIDLDNIGTSFDPDQVARLLYVAVSRARNRVIFFGELPPRFGGCPFPAYTPYTPQGACNDPATFTV